MEVEEDSPNIPQAMKTGFWPAISEIMRHHRFCFVQGYPPPSPEKKKYKKKEQGEKNAGLDSKIKFGWYGKGRAKINQ